MNHPETSFQKTVIKMAQMCGWKVAHFKPAMLPNGRWVTPVQADGKGFPDLLLVRDCQAGVVELKTDDGDLSDEQVDWIMALSKTPVHADVWRPNDWKRIETILTKGFK